MTRKPQPPEADKRAHRTVVHGHERVDEFFWLRDREDPAVEAYLRAENRYTEALTEHTADLQARLYQEMLGRIKQTDLTVPYRMGPYRYLSRTEEGKQYRVFCRLPLDSEDEQVILDHNALAEGHAYCGLGALAVSPDHRLLAYCVDFDGDERYELRLRELETGTDLTETIPNAGTSLAWANDNRTLFYTTLDDAHRPWRVHRHVLGTPVERDEIVYQEDDAAFFLGVRTTRSRAFVLIDAESRSTTEVRYRSADDPGGSFLVLDERRAGIEYHVEHHGERFFILTNEDAVNFRLFERPVEGTSRREVLPHRAEVKLESVDAFRDHLVVVERRDGLERIRVRELSTGEEHEVAFPEPAYGVWLQGNREFDTDTLRFHYTSMITPESVFDYDMRSGRRELLKEQEVLGGYDRSRYVTERIHATAGDGTRIPISLLRLADASRDGSAPLVLYGYGAYGMSLDPGFASERLSLVDRGFVYAVAHVRGGGEMGRPWYDDGKLLRKKNTFTDFIACAEHLVAEGYTSADRLVIRGASAGGLLIGAVLNMRPELFRLAVAKVPFVDVLNTMLDASIPLTVIEWEEWGDPRTPADYEYIRSYSPYDNVDDRPFPDLLVMSGLNDPRVQYWEPAKWVARLRAAKPAAADRVFLLKTNMDAGHAGASGRYDALKELAFEYALVLDRLGVGD